jgi:hypothetical protein
MALAWLQQLGWAAGFGRTRPTAAFNVRIAARSHGEGADFRARSVAGSVQVAGRTIAEYQQVKARTVGEGVEMKPRTVGERFGIREIGG